jgi:hypothetical protein
MQRHPTPTQKGVKTPLSLGQVLPGVEIGLTLPAPDERFEAGVDFLGQLNDQSNDLVTRGLAARTTKALPSKSK